MTKVPFFDPAKWDEIIKRPDWYMTLWPKIKDLNQNDDTKRQLRQYFIEQLRDGKVALATSGDNLDEQRQPVDTVVIHHTSYEGDYTLDRLNAVHMLNVYVPYYFDPHQAEERHLKGTALWSGHFYGDKQVFYAYHWFVRKDGSYQHLLEDGAIGWQAGNWDINCRSVAICLDDDLERKDPSPAMRATIIEIIRQKYPGVDKHKIIGHREANPKTICPGNTFLNGWKKRIIQELS